MSHAQLGNFASLCERTFNDQKTMDQLPSRQDRRWSERSAPGPTREFISAVEW